MPEDYPEAHGVSITDEDLAARIAAEMDDPGMVGASEALTDVPADDSTEEAPTGRIEVFDQDAEAEEPSVEEPARDASDHTTSIAEGAEHDDEVEPVHIAPVVAEPPKEKTILEAAEGYQSGGRLPVDDAEHAKVVRGMTARGRLADLEASGRVSRTDAGTSDADALDVRMQLRDSARDKAKEAGLELNSELGDAAQYAVARAKERSSGLEAGDQMFDSFKREMRASSNRAAYNKHVQGGDGSREGGAGQHDRKVRHRKEYYQKTYRDEINQARKDAVAMYRRDPERYKGMAVAEFLDQHKSYRNEMDEVVRSEVVADSLKQGVKAFKEIDFDDKSFRTTKDISVKVKVTLRESFGQVLGYEARSVKDKTKKETELQSSIELMGALLDIDPGEVSIRDLAGLEYIMDRLAQNPDRTARESAKHVQSAFIAKGGELVNSLQAKRRELDRKYGPEIPVSDLKDLVADQGGPEADLDDELSRMESLIV